MPSLGCLQFQCLPKSMQWFFVSPSRACPLAALWWNFEICPALHGLLALPLLHSSSRCLLPKRNNSRASANQGRTGGQNGWAKNHLKNFAINAAHWLQCPSSAVNVAVDVSVCINVQCAWFAESKCLRAHTHSHSHNAIYFCFGICCVSRFLFGLCSVCLFVCVSDWQ